MMSTLQYPMRRPWQLLCSICGEVSAETYEGFNFCEDCWTRFRGMMVVVDWKADPKFLVEKMKEKVKRK